MRRLTAAALFLGLVCTARAQDDAAKKIEAKKIEGSYQVVSITVNGKPDKKADDVKSFTIKDGAITINDGKKDETVKFTLDPTKKPAHIEIDPGKGQTVPGIYEAKETDKGLELTISFSRGPGSERPKDFKGEGERQIVIKLLRKK